MKYASQKVLQKFRKHFLRKFYRSLDRHVGSSATNTFKEETKYFHVTWVGRYVDSM